MTYNTYEISEYAGSPVELYEFQLGSMVWRYTNVADAVTLNSAIYTPIPVKRSAIQQTNELTKNILKITTARDADVIRSLIALPPSDTIVLRIYRTHRGDTDYKVIWMGRITSVEWKESEAEISAEPVYTSLKKVGLRRLYERACSHDLYGTKCQVNSATYRIQGVILSISGLVVTVQGAGGSANGYFAGGYISYLTSIGVDESRMVLNHTGDALTLVARPRDLVTGMQVYVYPGCDGTLATCNSKFANTDNYGGFPFFPEKNPFAGVAIY